MKVGTTTEQRFHFDDVRDIWICPACGSTDVQECWGEPVYEDIICEEYNVKYDDVVEVERSVLVEQPLTLLCQKCGAHDFYI